MDDNKEILLKIKGQDKIISGYFHTFYDNWNWYNVHNGERYFSFTNESSKGQKVKASEILNLDIEWWVYADENTSKNKQ